MNVDEKCAVSKMSEFVCAWPKSIAFLTFSSLSSSPLLNLPNESTQTLDN